ncbi:hypothetical protein MtrunA17_Chr4g0051581 [Medicago truncatula]|uniref:Fatty acid hydroxylase domain-containing protein n=1 Tax=Medicago truncatula TaxID=3880 RepID=A0A396IDE2_MEDTR|nr:hypothetical protein MtrunA17_Chr4g0051581 [Medicago truncatula]
MVAEKFVVDLNKPLVFQVGYLGEAYEEWVHQPIMSKESPRFFHSSFLEFFTRTVWWVVPIVWVPVASYFIYNSFRLGLPIPQITLFVLLGIFVWTLVEYLLHRFLFHVQTKSYWGNTFHFLFHGCHHKHPMDSLRLVLPPTAAVLFASPVFLFLHNNAFPYNILRICVIIFYIIFL